MPTCPGFISTPFLAPLAIAEGVQVPLPVGVPGVPAGDVLVFDVALGVGLGDVLRFVDSGGGIAHFVILLSDDPIEPEDTGLPPSFHPNTFSMMENATGATLYTAGAATYNIISDAEATPDNGRVPEPKTWGGVAGFLGAIWVLRRRRIIR